MRISLTSGPYESAVSMKLTPSSTARRKTRLHSSRSFGSPQMPSPVRRIAPKPRRRISMSPPRRNVVAVSIAVAIGKLLHGRSMREQLCRTQRILIRNDRSGRPLKSASAAALSPDDANLLPPAFVEREEIPLDRRGEIAQYGLCGRMNMQRGRDQIQARWKGRKLDATKVAMALELAKPGVWVCCL